MTGRRRVHRGLLGLTERGSPFRTTLSAKERADRKLETLQQSPLGAFAWKEAWQEFRHLSKSRPDLHGRRLLDDRAIVKAQYLARVAYRAWKGRALPEGRSWGHVHSALLLVYHALA